MNAVMFVAIMCLGQQCDFVVSNEPISEVKCEQLKKEFLSLPFKPEMTFAATQCVRVDEQKVRL